MPLYVCDVMVPAKSVRGDQPLQVALNLMAESSYDQIPVTEGDDGPLIGVISYRFLSEDRISYQFGPIPGEPTRDSMRPVVGCQSRWSVKVGTKLWTTNCFATTTRTTSFWSSTRRVACQASHSSGTSPTGSCDSHGPKNS